ncbi:MAG: hypothetical protein ACOYZ8_01370 [Chloroflexota bacterium]
MDSIKRNDWPSLLLLTALTFGAIVRFIPLTLSGFPLNDGGMFLVMTRDLRASGFLLPAFTQYNQIDIPFAYPPFGFYVAGFLSSLGLSDLAVFHWLPAIVNTGSILAFYFLARQMLDSRLRAALATVFYALAPGAFGWQVMGGGITRAFGVLFMLLAVRFTHRLFTRPARGTVLLSAMFCSLAVLSHPETALHTAIACALFWLFFGRTKAGVLNAALVAVGVILLTAPWWGTVIARHGFGPFQSVLNTGKHDFTALQVFLSLGFSGEVFFPLISALGVLGLVVQLTRRGFLLPLWILVTFSAEPRGGGVALIPLAMLAGIGFHEVVAFALARSREEQSLFDLRAVRNTFLGMTIYMLLGASVFGLQLVNTSLTAGDRAAMAWVNENLPADGSFVLITGREFSMTDPLQEWFPALTGQRSQSTLQGYEWLLGNQFFPRYQSLVDLQHCGDIACVEDWSAQTGLDYDYLLVKILPEGADLAYSTASLLRSAREADSLTVVYESKSLVIFQKVK